MNVLAAVEVDDRWIWATAAIVAGMFVGAIAAVFVRSVLDRDDRRAGLREIAAPLSIFVFWVLFATGIVVAVSVSSPDRLESVPTDVLGWLPNLAVAGLLLIGGYGLGLTIGAAVGRTIETVSGRRNRVIEQVVRTSVLVAAAILALSQLGVDTTVVDILIAGSVFGLALALAGISIIGGRDLARHVAAGRSLRRIVDIGTHVKTGDIDGVISELQTAHVIVETDAGRLVVPYGALLDQPFLISDPLAGADEADTGSQGH